MKRVHLLFLSFLLAYLGGISYLSAEDLGYFNLVNATGLEAPLEVLTDGKKLVKRGLKPGAQAGGGIKIGEHSILVQHPDCTETSLNIDIEKNKGSILIAYYIEEVDEETQELEKLLVVQKAPRLSKRDQWLLGLVNSTRDPEPITVRVGGTEYAVPQYDAAKVPDWPGRSINVGYKDETILSTPLDEKGAYIVVLSGSSSTKIRATLVSDVDYEFEFEKYSGKPSEPAPASGADASAGKPPPAPAPTPAPGS